MEPAYRYRAKLVRVVDGDTIDLDIDLGFYIRITERVRLEGVNTPEIFRVKKESDEYKRGIAAAEFVARRFADNGNECVVETKKRGKWRRWLGVIYFADREKSLNEELIERGLAERDED